MLHTWFSIIHPFTKAFCFSSTFKVYANYSVYYISAFTIKIALLFLSIISARSKFLNVNSIEGLLI